MSRNTKYLIAIALGSGLGGYILGRAMSSNSTPVIEDRTVQSIMRTIREIVFWA